MPGVLFIRSLCGQYLSIATVYGLPTRTITSPNSKVFKHLQSDESPDSVLLIWNIAERPVFVTSLCSSLILQILPVWRILCGIITNFIIFIYSSPPLLLFVMQTLTPSFNLMVKLKSHRHSFILGVVSLWNSEHIGSFNLYPAFKNI